MDVDQAYETLTTLVRELEADPTLSFENVVNGLRTDPRIDWVTIQKHERTMNPSVGDYKYYAIKRVTTPWRFPNGGDRKSKDFRVTKKHVAKQAALPPPGETVAADCIQKVAQRWPGAHSRGRHDRSNHEEVDAAQPRHAQLVVRRIRGRRVPLHRRHAREQQHPEDAVVDPSPMHSSPITNDTTDNRRMRQFGGMRRRRLQGAVQRHTEATKKRHRRLVRSSQRPAELSNREATMASPIGSTMAGCSNPPSSNSPLVAECARCAALLVQILNTSPHTSVAHKREQRDTVVAQIVRLLALFPKRVVNIFLFDDFLSGADGRSRLFTEELVERFGTRRIRIWAPNVKGSVVVELHRLAGQYREPERWLTTGCGCWHGLNDLWSSHIRERGGLDVVFADVFGCFDHGCSAFISDALKRNLFRFSYYMFRAEPTAAAEVRSSVVYLSWAVSKLSDRFRGLTDRQNVDRMVAWMHDAFATLDPRYNVNLECEKSYGSTMHSFVFSASPRHLEFNTNME